MILVEAVCVRVLDGDVMNTVYVRVLAGDVVSVVCNIDDPFNT